MNQRENSLQHFFPDNPKFNKETKKNDADEKSKTILFQVPVSNIHEKQSETSDQTVGSSMSESKTNHELRSEIPKDESLQEPFHHAESSSYETSKINKLNKKATVGTVSTSFYSQPHNQSCKETQNEKFIESIQTELSISTSQKAGGSKQMWSNNTLSSKDMVKEIPTTPSVHSIYDEMVRYNLIPTFTEAQSMFKSQQLSEDMFSNLSHTKQQVIHPLVTDPNHLRRSYVRSTQTALNPTVKASSQQMNIFETTPTQQQSYPCYA